MSEPVTSAAPAEPSIVRELLAGMVGAAVALACLLPPLIHFLTGPFGPAIGGFVAANWVKPGSRGRALIALSLGATLASLVGAIAYAIVGSGSAPSWFPAAETLGSILFGVAAWGAALGAVGAGFGARFAENKAARSGARSEAPTQTTTP